jgi:hypothetical protein
LTEAGGYILETKKTPYFDYVIIGGAKIMRGSTTAYVEYPDQVRGILENRNKYIKPLRQKGIKVLLGVSGGNDGVSFGNLTEGEQPLFARACGDACRLYDLDGGEFWDKNGEEPGGQTPYPAIGDRYWSGETLVEIPNTGDAVFDNAVLAEAWKDGGKYFADFLSYFIVAMGATTSFQGDIPDVKLDTPILVKEVNYGKKLPPGIPRFPFASTIQCVTYSINPDNTVFGDGDTGHSSQFFAPSFVGDREYAPALIDLSDAAQLAATLSTYSTTLGNGGQCEYGLIYYTNLQRESAVQTGHLSTTSFEVFGENVAYSGN